MEGQRSAAGVRVKEEPKTEKSNYQKPYRGRSKGGK